MIDLSNFLFFFDFKFYYFHFSLREIGLKFEGCLLVFFIFFTDDLTRILHVLQFILFELKGALQSDVVTR